MIYKKEAAFSYPVLHNDSFEYDDHHFTLRLNDLVLSHEMYQLSFDIDLSSEFLTNLLKKDQATIILVLQHKDSYFQSIELDQTMIEIPTTSIAFSERISAQLFIRANDQIAFTKNHDLKFIYDDYLDQIKVLPGQLLAYSNIDETEAEIKKNIDLFRYNYSSNLESEIQIYPDNDYINIDIREDIIEIFPQGHQRGFWIPFMYQGLQMGFKQLIDDVGDAGEYLIVDGQHHFDGNQTLNRKLYDLLENHGVDEISKERLDEVIYQISPNLIKTYYRELRRLADAES